MGIKENLERIRREIASSARASNSGDIVLVGVSKTFPIDQVLQAVEAGLSDIGENRIQEAETKFPMLPNVRKHFIGHLQGNKVKKAVELCDMIQSVDSLKIAGRISEAAIATGKVMPVLAEVMTDKNKQFGILPDDLEDFLKTASKLEGIRILGLMTVGPHFESLEDSRPIFREMKKLFDGIKQGDIPNVEMRYLSMGMSSDFAIAIEEGANMVRLGKAIFGERGDNIDI
jgi:hypothetical protein